MNLATEKISLWLAHYLQKEISDYSPAATTNIQNLKSSLQPGDILLVEGNLRVSSAIKYLTQSTWSHAAFYAGTIPDVISKESNASSNEIVNDPPCLIEADIIQGVIAVPLSKYADKHTRICRPIKLSTKDREKLISFMIDKLGTQYDIKNVIDLLRYLLPEPPVPVRWRRRMLALGSGDPTRAICSTLIAQSFQSIHYPILPKVQTRKRCNKDAEDCSDDEIMEIRHHSLFVPRDFDISPYFKIIKPTLESGFNYKDIQWAKEQHLKQI